MSGVDVLIVTALEMERDAIREAATWRGGPSGVRDWQQKDRDKQPEYLLGQYRLPDGRSISLALARPKRMGGISTGPVVSALMERLDPACVSMCGVCAGNPSDVALGDIVIANTVFQYDEGKRTENEFQGDIFSTPMDNSWVMRAGDVLAADLPSYGAASEEDARLWALERYYAGADPRKHPACERYFPNRTWGERILRMETEGLIRLDGRKFVITDKGKVLVDRTMAFDIDPPLTLPFAIKIGPMASGNAVVKDGVTWEGLKHGGQRATIALEMEAASVGATAYSRGHSKWIVVKGVMDHADPNKDDRYKKFAARASAEVLLRFLEQNASSICNDHGASAQAAGRGSALAEGRPTDPSAAKQEAPSRTFRLPDQHDDERLSVVVVCRESGSEALIILTERSLALQRRNLEQLSGKSIAAPHQIGENVFALNVGTAFASRAAMIDCLRAVCRADIVIFDVTGGGASGIEPGVMLLLGVRSVARRGVSICSVDHDPDQLFDVSLPYNLQQLNIASHAVRSDELDAAEKLNAKIANGLHDLNHDLTYLDLPAFDSIRSLGGDLSDHKPIPYYRGPLHLGPFNEVFHRDCLRKLEPEITLLLDDIARDKDGRDYKRPRLFRLLDYDRARMVSQSLYHAIRRHDFCLIDWTWLRPNVFFEFGVRLASRPSGDVHVVANLEVAGAEPNAFGLSWPKFSESAGYAADATRLTQMTGLREIFGPIEYKPRSRSNVAEVSAKILDRWEETGRLQHENAAIFTAIARAAAVSGKGAIASVIEFLRKHASMTYLHDKDTLLSTLLYEEHNPALQNTAVSQAIALKLAALFLTVSTGKAPESGLSPSDEIATRTLEIKRLAQRMGMEQDAHMLDRCLETIRMAWVPQ